MKAPKKNGRPLIDLPGSLSPEAHEARRLSLGISKRRYAVTIGMHFNTYARKVKHIDVGPPMQNGKLDFIAAATEFLRLRPQYEKTLQDELKIAESVAARANVRVADLRALLAQFKALET